MNEDIIILDNFLPLYLQNNIENICQEVKYEYSEGATAPISELEEISNNTLYDEVNQLCHIFWDTRDGGRLKNGELNYSNLENLSHYLLLPLQIGWSNCGGVFSLKENLIRAKVNITHRGNNNKPNTQIPHRDMDRYSEEYLRTKTWSIIYYVKDSEGDTIIYNEPHYLPNDQIQNYTIKKRISPKKGRMVLMRGNLIHSASHPPFFSKYYNRVVINYNLVF